MNKLFSTAGQSEASKKILKESGQSGILKAEVKKLSQDLIDLHPNKHGIQADDEVNLQE